MEEEKKPNLRRREALKRIAQAAAALPLAGMSILSGAGCDKNPSSAYSSYHSYYSYYSYHRYYSYSDYYSYYSNYYNSF